MKGKVVTSFDTPWGKEPRRGWKGMEMRAWRQKGQRDPQKDVVTFVQVDSIWDSLFHVFGDYPIPLHDRKE
jgi:hypothetical protein